MKPKNVHRGVSNMPTESTGAQAARVGKLSRIHRTYKSGVRRQRSRGKSRNNHNRLREYLNYFIGSFAALLMAAVGWMIYSQITKKTVTKETTTLTQDTFTVPHPDVNSCVAIAQKALASSAGDAWQEHVFLRNIEPEVFATNLEKLKKTEGVIEKIEWAGALEINDLSLEMVVVTFGSAETRVAYLTHDADGVWRLDGESFLEWQGRPWAELLDKGNCKAIVRMIVMPDSYYNGVFSDEKEWICLSLKSLNGENQLSGYVRPQSAVHLAIMEIFKTSVPAAVMVEISRNSAMEAKQFEIKRVIAHGWVESDVVFSSKFSSTEEKPN